MDKTMKGVTIRVGQTTICAGRVYMHVPERIIGPERQLPPCSKCDGHEVIQEQYQFMNRDIAGNQFVDVGVRVVPCPRCSSAAIAKGGAV